MTLINIATITSTSSQPCCQMLHMLMGSRVLTLRTPVCVFVIDAQVEGLNNRDLDDHVHADKPEGIFLSECHHLNTFATIMISIESHVFSTNIN